MLLASLHKEDIDISYFLFSGYLEFKSIQKRSEVKSIRVKIKKKKQLKIYIPEFSFS